MNEDFLNSDFIKTIKNKKQWCISVEKKPIDMHELFKTGKVWGVSDRGYIPYLLLDELKEKFEQKNIEFNELKSVTYHINTPFDDFFVLDIESSCDNETKRRLINTDFLYGEISSSGKGLHLIYPLSLIKGNTELEGLINRTKIQKKDKTLEFLFTHHVTFTGNQIQKKKNNKGNQIIVDELKNLLKENSEYNPVRSYETVDEPNLSEFNELIHFLENCKYNKTVEDFKKDKTNENDYSKYEFGFFGFFYWRLKNLLETNKFKNLNPNVHERAFILYNIAKEKLPKRKKHDTIRDGKPWLLFLAYQIQNKGEKD